VFNGKKISGKGLRMENIIYVLFIAVFLFTVYLWYQWSKELTTNSPSYREEEDDFFEEKIKTPKKNKPIKESKKKPMKEKNKSSFLKFGKKKEIENDFDDEDGWEMPSTKEKNNKTSNDDFSDYDADEWTKPTVKDRSKNPTKNDFSSYDDFDIEPVKEKNNNFEDDDFDFENDSKKSTKSKSLDLFDDGDLAELEGMFGNIEKTSTDKKNEFDDLDDIIIKNNEKEPEDNKFDFDFDFNEKQKNTKENNLDFLDKFDFESDERNLIDDEFFNKKKQTQKPVIEVDLDEDLGIDIGLFKDKEKKKNDLDMDYFSKKESKTEVKKETKSEFELDLDIGLDSDDDILKKIDKLYKSTKE
jgi:hypothetical protein